MINSKATQQKEREFSFSQQEFRFLADLANKLTGIVVSDKKKDMIYSRLVRRLRALSLNSFEQYCDFIQRPEGEEEIGNLVNAITTNLTSFFRESHHFDHLRDVALPQIIANPNSQKKLRIWSSAASSGMEAYSIAMVTKKVFDKHPNWDAKILGTDIDTNMLATGANGEYNISELENIPSEYRTLFSKNKEHILMNNELKELIAFKHLNLLENWPMKGKFDVIFCRNVVIYFDKPTQKKLFNRMADILSPNGWLYIGHSESLYNVCDKFELSGRTIYRKI